MSDRLKICVITGGRAEYGLLQSTMDQIRADDDLDLQLVVTGSHLEPGLGMTVDQIVADGFRIDARVPLDIAGDGPVQTAHAMARCLAGVSEALEALSPDIVLVVGDRYEILAAAQAAMLLGVPVAHIAGGDTTEGAFDENLRHALTKMAHIHLVTNEDAARRVRQLGEDPGRVHVVGSPGLDHLHRTPLLDRNALEQSLGAPLGARNLLVTFHPVTLSPDRGLGQFNALLAALDLLPTDIVKWITRANADPGRQALDDRLDAWAAGRADVHLFQSLGQLRYLSLMKHVDAVVGNSSSGLYEAPSFHIPTVDIGDRQQGRLAAASVIRSSAETGAIREAIEAALRMDSSGVENPYGDGHSAPRIVRILKAAPPRQKLLFKRFYEVGA